MKEYIELNDKRYKKENARSGVRTHASEENSTLNCRLGPLGHPCLQDKEGKGKNEVADGIREKNRDIVRI